VESGLSGTWRQSVGTPAALSASDLTISSHSGDVVINRQGEFAGVLLSGSVVSGASVAVKLSSTVSRVAWIEGEQWFYRIDATDIAAITGGTLEVVATSSSGASYGITKNVSKDVTAPTLSAQILFGETGQSASGSLTINPADRSSGVSLALTANESTVYVKLGDSDERSVELISGAGTYALTDADFAGLGNGQTTLRVRAVDAAGNQTTQILAVDVRAVSDSPASIANLVGDTGRPDFITSTRSGLVANGTMPVGSTVAVSFTWTPTGGSATVGTVAGADLVQNTLSGLWSATLPTQTTDGALSLSVVATNVAGVPASAATQEVRIDATAPDAPVVSTVGGLNGRPTLSGTAEADSLVSVYSGINLLGRTVAADGAWSFTPDYALSPGAHSFTAKANDVAGNVSAASTVQAHTVNSAGLSFLPVTGDNVVDAIERDRTQTPTLTLRGVTTASQVWVSVDGGAADSATVARTVSQVNFADQTGVYAVAPDITFSQAASTCLNASA
jgi:hypothetical protein